MTELWTKWGKEVQEHPEGVLSEYPRPMLVRDSYVNLNGYWDYAITKTKDRPKEFDGKILVPFSPEAPLSGVERQLQPKEFLWYQRTLPALPVDQEKRWILHFGAVDQFAVVFVNGKQVGKHLGGYIPFSIDVTDALRDGDNVLTVVVQDATEDDFYARGKQKLDRGGMFYTAQSGIWQTVWMEEVPTNYVERLVITPSYDEELVRVQVQSPKSEKVKITVRGKGSSAVQRTGMSGEIIVIPIKDMHSWSPEDPYLYDLKLTMGEDKISSYFAMRKISMAKDSKGLVRPLLNNKPYFQRGILDQGYWPEGLMTAPSDEALIFDIQKMKDLGFNMLRKHVKIESQRWYYHCDRMGMLVWQDMVCGGRPYKHWYVTYLATVFSQLNLHVGDNTYGLLGRKDEAGKKNFIDSMTSTIQYLYNHPCIVTWVIFNEGWGQFDATRVTKIARGLDSTRLLDQASGWFDQGGGDYRSVHEYFFRLIIKAEDRVGALTEFGGYSYAVPNHTMFNEVYGYKNFHSTEELSKAYGKLMEREILPNIEKGLSVTTYTQLSDIEEEVNGIYTYDRDVMKFDPEVIKKYNEKMQLEE